MLTEYRLTALTITISLAHLITALPSGVSAGSVVRAAPITPDPNSVLYAWSNDPACASTACAADCMIAAATVCNSTNLNQSYDATENACSAFYYPGSTPPTPAQCTASFTQIVAAAQQPASGCGGTIGGALGYDSNGNRTSDPLYAIYPANGNANCFKAPGDTSPVLAPDMLPNSSAAIQTCPDSTSRRRALDKLQGRGNAGDAACALEDGVWGFSCTAICLATVVSTSWITGPFAAAAWLACLGGCSATGTTVFNNCAAAKGSDTRIPYNPLTNLDASSGNKRRDVEETNNPCLIIKDYSFGCPAMESGLLNHFECQQTSAGSANGASSGINT
ncbi:hypothetical protein P7C71_g680, partial [Lecanoromycetidae sp. Uapishka_2]